jgi:hypothetical protein
LTSFSIGPMYVLLQSNCTLGTFAEQLCDWSNTNHTHFLYLVCEPIGAMISHCFADNDNWKSICWFPFPISVIWHQMWMSMS